MRTSQFQLRTKLGVSTASRSGLGHQADRRDWCISRAWAKGIWRYVGGFEECEDDDCKGKYRSDVEEVPPSRKVDSHSLFNVRGSYELGTTFGYSTLTIGINNLLDQPPAVIYNGFLGTSDASTYDFLGRYLYVRLSHAR